MQNSSYLQILLCFFFLAFLPAINAKEKTDPKNPGFNNHPLTFIENKGQVADVNGNPRPDILFMAMLKDINIYITKNGIVYQFQKQMKTSVPDMNDLIPHSGRKENNTGLHTYRMEMNLLGTNENPTISKQGERPDYTNYYLAHCPDGILGVKSYEKIIVKNIYPNIDWVIYIKDDQMEYDFNIRPGGEIKDIKIKYDGAIKMMLEQNGSLSVSTPLGTIKESAPISFLEDGKPVISKFVIKDDILSFVLDTYDRDKTLTIDPVVLWEIEYGGVITTGLSCKVASDGSVYMSGSTTSTTGISMGGFDNSYNGGTDAYLAKFNNAGVRLWGTYYGGTSGDYNRSMCIDPSGNILVCGATSSAAGIASGGWDNVYDAEDGFIVKFNSAGGRIWGTYYGNAAYDEVNDIVTNNSGEIYFAGSTASTSGISTPGSHQPNKSEFYDCFLVKMSSAGTRLWSTYYGGTNFEFPYGIDVDASGNVYFAGYTNSTSGIASPGSWDNILSGSSDGFIVKFNSSGVRQWGTYIGGPGNDNLSGLSIDNTGNVLAAGGTDSSSGLANGGFDNTFGGQTDAFLVKFNTNGTRIWSTYFGGTGSEGAAAVEHDNNNNIYIGGFSTSTGLAFQGFQNTNNGWDGFIVKFTSSGNRIWSSYFGAPSIDDRINAIACENADVLYFCGNTEPEVGFNSEDNSRIENMWAFLVKVDICSGPPTNITANICQGQTYMFNGQTLSTAGTYNASIIAPSGCDSMIILTLTVTNIIVNSSTVPSRCSLANGSATASGTGGVAPYTYFWSNGGTNATIQNVPAGNYTVTVTDANSCNKVATVTITNIPGLTGVQIDQTPTTCGLANGSATAEGIGGTAPLTYFWSNFQNTQTISNLSAGPYTVTVTDANDCEFTQTVNIPFSLELASTNVPQSPQCGQSDGAISVTVLNGTGPYVYELIGPVNLVSNSTSESTYLFTGLPSGNYFYRVTDANGCIEEDFLNLMDQSGLMGNATTIPVQCSNNNGSITATVETGTAPYIYSLDGPVDQTSGAINASNFTFNNLPEGNYLITITDVNQCTFLFNINVVSENNFSGTNITEAAHCDNPDGNIEISVAGGTAPFIYSVTGPVQLTGPATNNLTFVFDNLPPGAYEYTVQDGNGCETSENFIIENTEGVNLGSTLTQSDCGQPNGSITLTASNGVAPYIYSISGNVNMTSGSTNDLTFIFINLPAGSYEASVLDGSGCSVTSSLIIDDKNGVVANISSVDEECTSANGSITINAVGGTPPYIYELSGDGSATSGPTNELSFTFSDLDAGNYVTTVTDANQCKAILLDTILSINALQSNTTSSSSECAAPTGSASIFTSGGEAPFVFELSGSVNLNSGSVNAAQFSFNSLPSGLYNYTVTDDKGCESSGTIVVENESNFSGSAFINNTTCGENNGSVILTAINGSAPFTYSVDGPVDVSINSIPDDQFELSGLSGGDYIFRIEDLNGCLTEGLITIDSSVSISLQVETSGFDCGGGSGNISVVPDNGASPYLFSLNNGPQVSSGNFTNLLPNANYLITVEDAAGCQADSTITPIADVSFNAVTDTVFFDFYSNPVVLDVLSNDDLGGLSNFNIEPVRRDILNSANQPIGTLISKNNSTSELEFFYHGNYDAQARKYELNYPLDKEIMKYLLCTDDCPDACDTGIIVLISKYECIEKNGNYVNTFTPNGDGKNDVLVLPQFPKCNIISSSVKIFNRWGEAVFSAENYENNWDGKNDNGVDLVEGTYYYILKLDTQEGKEYVVKNFVELLR